MTSLYCGFFFFKQKTAYEMRISDWSSDVCSSDLARALYQSGDIDKAELGRDDLGGPRYGGKPVKPFVGHRDLPDIGLDRAKRIIRGLRGLRLGQCIEQGGLADIRQADEIGRASCRERWCQYV